MKVARGMAMARGQSGRTFPMATTQIGNCIFSPISTTRGGGWLLDCRRLHFLGQVRNNETAIAAGTQIFWPLLTFVMLGFVRGHVPRSRAETL